MGYIRMKHVALALFVIAMLIADLVVQLEVESQETRDGWDFVTGGIVLFAMWWFWHHRDDN